MVDEFPSRALDKIVIRVPDGMRDRLAEAARMNGRSMNADIVARLQVTLDADEGLGFNGGLAKEEIDRIANFAAAKAAVEAIDAVLGMISLPDGTPDAERFQAMVRKNADLKTGRRKGSEDQS